MIQNSKLKNLFKLSSKVTVYVPSTENISSEIDSSEYVNRTASLLSKCFGGSTASNALGYWISDKEGLVKEKTTIVFAYCNEQDLNDHIEKVIDACENMKKELNQEAVAMEINGEMYFI